MLKLVAIPLVKVATVPQMLSAVVELLTYNSRNVK